MVAQMIVVDGSQFDTGRHEGLLTDDGISVGPGVADQR